MNNEDHMSAPIKVVVVYHSGYGHTVKIAEAVAKGAATVEGAVVSLIETEEAPTRWDILDEADAIIMGAPTYMGSLSAPFKAFMDAMSHLQPTRWPPGSRTAPRVAATSKARLFNS